MRATSQEWHDALNAGKESVVCDLPGEREFACALLRRADIVVESFRPGVAARLGVGPADVPARIVYCSITGFGEGRHERRAGHDLNYAGWAGLLERSAPALPPAQIADLAGGGLGAVVEILAALLTRERSGRGAHLTISMTHLAHAFASRAPVLTDGVAYYRMYATADGRYLTVGALEPKFFARLCSCIGRPELAPRQFDADQRALGDALAAVFATRALAEWLSLFDGEDVCLGPVATRAEAAAEFALPVAGPAPAVGAHTRAWRAELGLEA
jgi:crotonobetainyl-CoA:carnitine CoA-transferase CaiB-like acyl-CoA transferase